ncbi:myozenin-3 [Protopterus annectens]|uniref:myozenin-3 n=1 Tax=Protopterus annectens TaxID=7888 RepID=UPI001CFA1CAA|nr:myozenin-3 [Protopterus annectens]
MTTYVPYSTLTKEHKGKAMAVSREMHGGRLNLGKKVSVPLDVMMEELSLQSNKGSRMFQERQKRVDKYVLEMPGQAVNHNASVQNAYVTPTVVSPGGKENYRTEIFINQPTSKGPLKTFKRGTKASEVTVNPNPSALAPGYSGPLKNVPPEKFNRTVIPKSYQTPWHQALLNEGNVIEPETIQISVPPGKQSEMHYRCFNRAPIPYGGSAGPIRVVSFPETQISQIPQVEMVPKNEWEELSRRPNFNRAPRGWIMQHVPESGDL